MSASTLVIPLFLAYNQAMRFMAAITMLVLAITLAQSASAQLGIKITAKQLEVMRTETRVALVIGNASYEREPLRNPVNDARAVSKKLRSLGFEGRWHGNTAGLQNHLALHLQTSLVPFYTASRA